MCFIIQVAFFEASLCDRKILHFCTDQGRVGAVLCVAPGECRGTVPVLALQEAGLLGFERR